MAAEATIWGYPVEAWEEMMQAWDTQSQSLRGIRIEPMGEGCYPMTQPQYMPFDPWLGIHHDGPRMGSRIALRDIGWVE